MDELTPDLVVTAEGPVRLIELNRPEQRNAASEALHTALAGVWDRVAADDEVRAAVTVRLQTLLSSWMSGQDGVETAAVTTRLRAATADEVLDFIDKELGMSLSGAR